MCPPLVYGEDYDAEPWRILMFGDRDQTLVCSSLLSIDPNAELDKGEGACHEDASGIGDVAGNAVYYLQFPLEYPDALPPAYFDSLEEITFEDSWSETIAGHSARCYAMRAEWGEETGRRQECFAGSGAIVYRQGNAFLEYTLRAESVGAISEGDFDLAYPYVNAEID